MSAQQQGAASHSSDLTDSPAWQALVQHHRELAGVHMRDLFDADPGRFERFAHGACGLLLDVSKNRITSKTLGLLLDLAEQADLSGWRRRLFGGEAINNTERRAVLHMALRNRAGTAMTVDGVDVMPAVIQVLQQMRSFTDSVRFGTWTGFTGRQITDVVHIGIGGSDLGPQMVCEALRPYHHPDLRVRFVSNVDGTHLAETLAWLDPETTLFVIASKTFTTLETMANATSARTWFLDEGGREEAIAQHFVAVSTNRDAVAAFGIDPENMFVFWDWVGGRTSVWSAVGLPVALALGMDLFETLLAGAHAMDRHFREAPAARNLPVLLALTGIWNINFEGCTGLAVLPYEQYLHRLPAYLQQLEMESLGKSVDRDGRPVDYATAPILFGEPGTNGQHAFYQLLHQGTPRVAADFIGGAESHNPVLSELGWHQDILLANLLAQSAALMRGKTVAEAEAELSAAGVSGERLALLAKHRSFSGNRPSNTLLYRKLDPETLGALLALYEHKVFVQSVIWKMNAYDQWGVELGKQMAKPILAELAEPDPEAPIGSGYDASTHGLLTFLRRNRS